MADYAHFDAAHPVTDALCLSAFLVSLDEEGLLVGKMQDPEAWRRLDAVMSTGPAFGGDRWVLPAGHLQRGEAPDAAAERIAREQLLASSPGLEPWRVLSFAEPMPSRGEDLHWDLCFVYRAAMEVSNVPPSFAELRRLPLARLTRRSFARGHGEVLEALGLLLSSAGEPEG